MKQRIVDSLVTVVIATLLAATTLSFRAHRQYSQVKEHLTSVNLGMSRENVLAIVGKPKFVKDVPIGNNKSAEMWCFPHHRTESEAPRCVFSSTGTVIQIVIDENHRVGSLD